MNDRRAHVVVARRRAVGVLVLLECDGRRAALDGHAGHKLVRLGDLRDRFEKAVAVGEGEDLPRSVRPHRLHGNAGGRQSGAGCEAQTEARRNAVLEQVERRFAGRCRDPLRFLGSVAMPLPMPMFVPMAMPVMVGAAEQPRANDVDREAERRDRDRLAEMDRHGRKRRDTAS